METFHYSRLNGRLNLIGLFPIRLCEEIMFQKLFDNESILFKKDKNVVQKNYLPLQFPNLDSKIDSKKSITQIFLN